LVFFHWVGGLRDTLRVVLHVAEETCVNFERDDLLDDFPTNADVCLTY
jgi:hypothetical protein